MQKYHGSQRTRSRARDALKRLVAMLLNYRSKTRWLDQVWFFRTSDFPAPVRELPSRWIRCSGHLQRELCGDSLSELLLQPTLRKAVDKEENYNKWVTPMTRQKTIYSNLELHGWLNLLCYSADAEKENKTPILFRWLDKSSRT